MPSSTFYNLPNQKRERLLSAAVAEFARVPYPEASINQIIRTAGIPRGSFYMYFRDKEELFSFLIMEYMNQVEALVVRLLADHGGDPFTAFPALYDYVIRTSEDSEWREAYENAIQIIRRNGASLIGTFIEQAAPSILAATKREMDTGVLYAVTEDDLEDCVRILLPIAASAVKDGLLSSDSAAVRARFLNQLNILARGMSGRSSTKKE